MMRIADQFKTEPDPHTSGSLRIRMVCAAWQMTPRRQVFIGAADIEALAAVWYEITGTELDKLRAQYVYMTPQNPFNSRMPAAPTRIQGRTEEDEG
jgi:hypothetical protein